MRPRICDLKRFPSSLVDGGIDGCGELFHAEDEEIRGQQITLLKTVRRLERRQLVPVPKNRVA
jgi:hypothetical protein